MGEDTHYLQRTLILVEHADEMAFGLKQQPELWLPQREEFVRIWIAGHASGKKAVAILSPGVFKALRQQGVPMRIIAEDPRRVIVTNDFRKHTAT